METIAPPVFWEALLKRYVKKTFYTGTRKEDFAEREGFTEGDYRFFARGIEKLSIAFTEERSSLPKNYFNQKELRSGYLLYFLPVNALKTAALLELPPSPRLSILDIGSGPGTGMFGVFYRLESILDGGSLPEMHLEWDLVDQNREALNDARHLHEILVARLKSRFPQTKIESVMRLHVGNLFSDKISQVVSKGGRDLVLALNFLSELPSGKRVSLVEVLARDYLAPKGRILVMEPALRLTTRDLMKLRDDLLERDSVKVLAPCLHQAACPMLRENNRDWCHTYIPWQRPPWIEKIDQLVGIWKDYLKCSYLLLGHEAPPISPNVWRVVSGPLNSKGKTERLLCGSAGLPNLLRAQSLDRDETPMNRAFGHAERGETIRLEKTNRIGPKTSVEKIP